MQDDTHTPHTHQVATNDKPRRKKVKGPNPLSVKKAITKANNVEGVARAARKRQHRKRRGGGGGAGDAGQGVGAELT